VKRSNTLNSKYWRNLGLALLLGLGALAGLAAKVVYGQDAITITQIDPSKFPEMVVYIDAEASKLPAGLTPKDFQVTEDGAPAEIVDFAGEGEQRPVDVVFVFDTTSSMGGEIDGAIRSSVAFAEQLRAANRDFRLGLVAFGDEIRAIANPDFSLTADAGEFTGWVRQLRAVGGGDDPEASLDALEQATAFHFRPDAQKVILLITDAAPHEGGDGSGYSRLTAAALAPQLRDAGFVVYAVAADDPRFEALASETGGKFYELTRSTDFSGMIEEIGGDIAKQYRLTYKSPRSSYDGTTRDIAITVGGKTGEQAFLEPHLINIQSSLPIFLGLLAVLLLALAVPAWFGGRPAEPAAEVKPRHVPQVPAQAAAGAAAQGARAQAPAPAVAAAGGPVCPTCGRPIRPGARFCSGCGAKVQAWENRP
jgi:VWFA-related protein